MYDKYFVRKQEISENVLMIAICDVERDGSTTAEEDDESVETSSFNIGQLDLLFFDYQDDFKTIADQINEISKNIA